MSNRLLVYIDNVLVWQQMLLIMAMECCQMRIWLLTGLNLEAINWRNVDQLTSCATWCHSRNQYEQGLTRNFITGGPICTRQCRHVCINESSNAIHTHNQKGMFAFVQNTPHDTDCRQQPSFVKPNLITCEMITLEINLDYMEMALTCAEITPSAKPTLCRGIVKVDLEHQKANIKKQSPVDQGAPFTSLR